MGFGTLDATSISEGVMTQDAFETYIAAVLVPTLQAGDVVLD